MYGLPSRESLSKRQAKWIRDVDESVRSNPAQRAINREPVANPIRDKTSIISLMADPSFDVEPDPVLKSNEDSGSKQSLASKQNPMLRRTSGFTSHFMNILPDVGNLELETLHAMILELKKNYEKLRQDHVALQKLVEDGPLSGRIQDRGPSEDSISRLSKRVEEMERVVATRSTINSSDFSLLPSVQVTPNSTPLESLAQARHGRREFLPYYIKEDYAGRDNLTTLNGVHMDLVVEILGHYPDSPIIYPFGESTDLPNFAPFTMELDFKDADDALNGTAYGAFKREQTGIYTIEIVELHSDGEASGIEKYTLPLTLRCKMDLYLE